MTDAEIASHAIKQAENKIGELSMRERAVARAAAEAALELKWQDTFAHTTPGAYVTTTERQKAVDDLIEARATAVP